MRADTVLPAAVRAHFIDPPPGSKMRAAVDFGVDISLMEPPAYSDGGGRRSRRFFGDLLSALAREDVRFVVIGGVALLLHGSTRVTWDLDIVYERSRENIDRLVRALAPFNLLLRLAHGGKPIPFLFDAQTIWNGSNFTLINEALDIEMDLLGGTEDLPTYADALRESERIDTIPGMALDVLSLTALLRIKLRLNRVKDQLAVPEIEALIELREIDRASRDVDAQET